MANKTGRGVLVIGKQRLDVNYTITAAPTASTVNFELAQNNGSSIPFYDGQLVLDDGTKYNISKIENRWIGKPSV